MLKVQFDLYKAHRLFFHADKETFKMLKPQLLCSIKHVHQEFKYYKGIVKVCVCV